MHARISILNRKRYRERSDKQKEKVIISSRNEYHVCLCINIYTHIICRFIFAAHFCTGLNQEKLQKKTKYLGQTGLWN